MITDIFQIAELEGEQGMCDVFQRACSNGRFKVKRDDVAVRFIDDGMQVYLYRLSASRFESAVCSLISFMCRFHKEATFDVNQFQWDTNEWNAEFVIKPRSL